MSSTGLRVRLELVSSTVLMSAALLLNIFRNRERTLLPFDFLGLASKFSGDDFGSVTEYGGGLTATGRECGRERQLGGREGGDGVDPTSGAHVTRRLRIESTL